MRIAISAGVAAALSVVTLRLGVIDLAVAMLILLVAVIGFAMLWGWAEALAAAVSGSLGLAYFLQPHGSFFIASAVHQIDWAAFLLIAVGIGQLAARSKRFLEERRGLVNLSLDPLCLRNINDANFKRVNPTMVALLGWSEKELCSRPWQYFVHPDDHGQTAAAFDSLSQDNRTVDFENRYRTKDGRWLWLQWRAAVSATGESWIFAAARNITDIKEKETNLRDLTAQLMTAREEERSRIARDLHDDFTQRLSTLGIELGLLKRDEPAPVVGELRKDLSRIQTQILELCEDIRKLSHSLHPRILEHSDLAASLEALCKEFAAQHEIAATFTGRHVPEDIPYRVKVALYRIAQESLHNVVRHSGGTCVSVTLAGGVGIGIRLDVIDNGMGFNPVEVRYGSRFGLVSIEERTRQIGGAMTIDSVPDAGTRLTVQVPLPTANEGTPNEA